MENREEKIREAIKLRYRDQIEVEKQRIIKEVTLYRNTTRH